MTYAHLAPFVDVSRQKLRKQVREEFTENGIEIDEEKINNIAESRLKKEVASGIQTIQYQLQTIMGTNGF